MKPYFVVLLATAALLPGARAAAQAPAPLDPALGAKTLHAQPLAGTAPVIDGRLDEPIWATAAVATDFVQRRPNPGANARQKTEARVLYDDDAVYVGLRLYDAAPDSIASQLARRDASGIFSDWADVIIDSYHDRRTAYRFSVNPRGVQKDVYHYDDGNEDVSWDAVWEVQVSTDAEGWVAEYRIPLSQLRFTPSEDDSEQVWGIQFGRTVARTEEQSFWAPSLPSMPGFISHAGELRGVRGLGSPKRLELLPYTVAKVTRAPEPAGSIRSPFWKETDPAASFGADLKYGITSNLTLTGTINPDFGQVEADPSVVNLSAFETFFSEQRPFFLEGASLFTFNVGDGGAGEQLFYSRRIGRRPQRSWFDGADHTELPEATTILGAAKLTGRTAGGWSIGVFDAVTQHEEARLLRNDGIERESAEPLTNYAVARVNRDMRRGLSTMGAMFTATHRDLEDDAFSFLRTAAYTWGLNGRHRFGPGNNLTVQGFLSGSSIYGDTVAIQQAQRSSARYYQRPDADHVEYDPSRTSLHGLGGQLYLGKMGGKLTGGFGGRFRTPGYEINDVGFQNNADQAFVFGEFNYNEFNPGRIFRNWNLGMNPSSGYDFGGTRLWTQVNLWGGGNFHNFWNVNFFANQRWDAWSTGALRGGPAIVSPGSNNWNFNINSDRRKSISFNLGTGGWIEHGTDAKQLNFWGGLYLRPSSRLDVSLSPSYNHRQPTWQYVASPSVRDAAGNAQDQREYVFAALDQKTTALTARISYTASPTLSFQFYAQPFISAGDYRTYRRVQDPQAERFGDRFQDFAAEDVSLHENGAVVRTAMSEGEYLQFGNPNFNVRQLRSNAVVRWQYRPGSTLFLVWSSGRGSQTRDGTLDMGRDIDRLFGDAGTNVLLVKMNYWLNF